MNKVKISGIYTRPYESTNEKFYRLDFTITISRNETKNDYIDCCLWNKKDMLNGINEGDEVLVEGKLRKDVWKDKFGNWVTKTYVVVESIELLNDKEIEPNEDSYEQVDFETNAITNKDDLPF